MKVLYHLWACTRKQLVKDLFKRIIGFESWQMNDLEVPMDGRAVTSHGCPVNILAANTLPSQALLPFD